ncbi:CheR family methyltransferase [Nitrincola nitratireducens]|uniref:Chemotaxis protein methyltransferase n=1 Tax=Nitrincola nitratireducens TaxID=1229521 RepID=W9VP37_9GAMM|nr:CheR family methyltransferase [Nitrincola nitratireducens]EXJ12240.1 Chemotaxis protein methyltransferase [Nitrincola nitratireducens]
MIDHDHLTDKDHDRIAEFINSKAGIQLPYHKRSLIEARLRRRQKVTQHQRLTDYINYALADESDESIFLIDALTTNKTHFFREEAHFDFLKAFFAKPINRPKACLNVWSAGCSSGEEPYTLAMVLSELKERNLIPDFQILATDISISVLAAARNAVYANERLDGIPEHYRKRYLLRCKNPDRHVFRIAPELRTKVKFDTFNLITGDFKDVPLQDIIFCRNVMIYFTAEQKNKIIASYYQRLSEKGMLFLGHSEGLTGKNDHFEQVVPTVYQRAKLCLK